MPPGENPSALPPQLQRWAVSSTFEASTALEQEGNEKTTEVSLNLRFFFRGICNVASQIHPATQYAPANIHEAQVAFAKETTAEYQPYFASSSRVYI